MSPQQRELAEKHGTPSQMEDAIWAAWAQLFLTTDEAIAAIDKYRADFYAAGSVDS